MLFPDVKLRFRQIFVFQRVTFRLVAQENLALFGFCRGVDFRAFFAALFLAEEFGGELDVGDGIIVRKEVELLEHQSEVQSLFAYVFRIFLVRGIAVEEHFAAYDNPSFVGGFEEVQATEQSGLAAAGRADYGEHFAFLQLEIDAFEHLVISETFFSPATSSIAISHLVIVHFFSMKLNNSDKSPLKIK